MMTTPAISNHKADRPRRTGTVLEHFLKPERERYPTSSSRSCRRNRNSTIVPEMEGTDSRKNFQSTTYWEFQAYLQRKNEINSRRGDIRNNTVLTRAKVNPDAPRRVNNDSKRHEDKVKGCCLLRQKSARSRAPVTNSEAKCQKTTAASKNRDSFTDGSHKVNAAADDRQKSGEINQPASWDDEKLCKICIDNAADVVIMPCRHLCLCEECGLKMKGQHSNCPICRSNIESTLKIYIS